MDKMYPILIAAALSVAGMAHTKLRSIDIERVRQSFFKREQSPHFQKLAGIAIALPDTKLQSLIATWYQELPPPIPQARPIQRPKPPVPPTRPTVQRPAGQGADQAAGQEQGGYDFSLEKTYNVRIKSVAEPQGPETGAQGVALVTLAVMYEGREYLVPIGTSDFLKKNGSSFAPGDEIAIKGTIKEGTGMRIVAREITKGEAALTLIDKNGRPIWQPGQRTGIW